MGEPDGWARWLRGGEETARWAHARKGGGAVVCDWSRAPGSGEAAEALCLFGPEVKRRSAGAAGSRAERRHDLHAA